MIYLALRPRDELFPTMKVLKQLLRPLIPLLFIFPHLALSGDPTSSHTLFPNLPTKLFYFDDTTTILFLDSKDGNVWRSSDEGKTWNPVDGVPRGKAWDLVMHSNNREVVRHSSFSLSQTLINQLARLTS
jgi:hypothetical protein